MLHRRTLLTTAAAAVFLPVAPAILRAQELPGVSATEIRIGNTMPYSGPASAYGTIGKAIAAVFRMANDEGGFAGRKVNFLSYDDGYSPPKTVEQTRRLIEEDKVAAMFAPLGTPTNSATVRYINQKKVPDLFLATGADKWGDYKDYPWTIGWQPSYVTESQVYAKYILAQQPSAKIGILYQNDDFGKDYLNGVRDILKGNWDKQVTAVSYEVTDATIDSQLVSLQTGGVDVLMTIATPKFAAQAGDPQGFRDELEADAYPVRGVGLGRRGDAAGRSGEWHRHHQLRLSEGPDRPALGQRRGNEAVAHVHGQILSGRRREGRGQYLRLRSDSHHAACAEGVRERPLAREHDEAGDQPARCGEPHAAAGDQAEHQCDELPPDPPASADALVGQDLGPVWRHHLRRVRLTGWWPKSDGLDRRIFPASH